MYRAPRLFVLSRRRPCCAFRRTRSAFTLVELLVVIAIIALLISILLPSLRRAREQAKSVTCLSNIRGLAQASLLFAGDHQNRFQLAADTQAIQQADPSKFIYEYDRGELLAWPVALAASAGWDNLTNLTWGVRADDWAQAREREAFMDDTFDLAVCPADLVKISTPFYPEEDSFRDLTQDENYPADGERYFGYLSYGINEDIVGSNDLNGPNPEAPDVWANDCRGQVEMCAGDRLRGNLDKVFDPGTCLLLIDAGPDSEIDAQINPDGFANLIISAQAPGPYLEDFQAKFQKRMPRKRHPDGRLNVLFADFHGAAVRPVEFYSNEVLQGIPAKYDTTVRVSPYKPVFKD